MAISSLWAKIAANLPLWAWIQFSVRAMALARSQEAVWWSTSLRPGYLAKISRAPASRCNWAEVPMMPWSISTPPCPLSFLAIASIAMRPASKSLEPM